MNCQPLSSGSEEIEMKIFESVKKWRFPFKFKRFFHRFLTYTSFKRPSKENYIYKLSSDDKILSSLILKTCRTCIFYITSGKQMSNKYAPCFIRTVFVVIPSYIELPWVNVMIELYSWMTCRRLIIIWRQVVAPIFTIQPLSNVSTTEIISHHL